MTKERWLLSIWWVCISPLVTVVAQTRQTVPDDSISVYEDDSLSKADSAYRHDWGVEMPLDKKHLSVELGASAGSIIVADKYEKMWITGKPMKTYQVALRYRTLPSDSDGFAHDYNYPEWALTLMLGDYSGVKMHKTASPQWGLADEVGYTSDMGHLWALYASFSRPLWRTERWELGYTLDAGGAYSLKPYDKEANVDNELVGSRPLIYFGASLYAAYRLSSQWRLRADLGFRHVSNGALDRPNKGANSFSPNVSLIYDLSPYEKRRWESNRWTAAYRKRWYGSLTLNVGGKALLEEWLLTQFNTPSASPQYRTSHFRIYVAYGLQADVMYRYARRWATGGGIDVFYGTYSKRVREIDEAKGVDIKHSPWSVGLAVKHEAFYGRLSMYVSLGVYLYRQMGATAREDETPYYERVGIKYHFPKWHGFFVGAGIKAHRTKADLAEVTAGFAF